MWKPWKGYGPVQLWARVVIGHSIRNTQERFEKKKRKKKSGKVTSKSPDFQFCRYMVEVIPEESFFFAFDVLGFGIAIL